MNRGTPEYDAHDVRTRAESAGQGHLFAFWDRLDASARRQLIVDLAGIDFDLLRSLFKSQSASEGGHAELDEDSLQPAPTIPDPRLSAERQLVAPWRHAGIEHIRRGAVAALTVAGGQGTRLGFDGPKGLFPISPIRGASLFQGFAEGLLAARRRFGRSVPWYIMTSPGNNAATQAYFVSENHFGLDRGDVKFFMQGVMPVAGMDGRILLEAPNRPALAPDGHGGCLTALAASGCLADMGRRGIETVSYFQIDNPLVRPMDPVLIGAHLTASAEATTLTIPKADDFERVGNFVSIGGKVHVIEYTELPERVARRRDASGRRAFDAANLSIYVFSTALLERLTAQGGQLPWHRAIKKAAYLDLATGQRVEPSQPNALKFERFIFDALPLAERVLLVQSERGECFSPVKNSSGVDSAEQARRDLSRRAAEWLAHCGVRVPIDGAGVPLHPCEISPLVAEDADELSDVLRKRPTVDVRGPICLVE